MLAKTIFVRSGGSFVVIIIVFSLSILFSQLLIKGAGLDIPSSYTEI